MEEIKLDVQIREKVGARGTRMVRGQDRIPAIVYGGDCDATAIQIDRRSMEKIMRQHTGQSLVFHMNVMDGDKKVSDCSAILKDEQRHPVRENILHLDFKRISLDEEVGIRVRLDFRGEAPGVKSGGSLEHTMWELDVLCLPRNIPEKIVVDVSSLAIGDIITVGEIVMPEGIRTEHDPESVVVTVAPPMREEEAVAADNAQTAEPEVIKKEKKDQEAAGAAK
jgi:large subunit ribosomal protein L25